MYKIFFTIVFVVIFLAKREINCFGKRRCRFKEKSTNIKDKDNEEKFFSKSLLTDFNDEKFIDPHCNCGNNGLGIVQNIEYHSTASCHDPVNIKFSSACIRCGLCLAVAEQINQTLIETHDAMRSKKKWLNDTEASSLIKSICDSGFRHYGLREINGKRYICDRIPGATLVTSTADGSWEKNLKSKCNDYVSEIGAIELYKYWRRWSGFDGRLADLNTILCRHDSR